MTDQTYSSVLELTNRISEDAEFPKELEDTLRRRQMIKKLMAFRASNGLSQEELGEKMGCSQSRISKLESSNDDDLRLGDLREYLEAVDLDLGLVIARRNWSVTDKVKFHAFQIRDCLHHLVDLAAEDPVIGQGVQEFHIEAILNMVDLIAASAQRLPKNLATDAPGVIDAGDGCSECADLTCDEPLPVA